MTDRQRGSTIKISYAAVDFVFARLLKRCIKYPKIVSFIFVKVWLVKRGECGQKH